MRNIETIDSLLQNELSATATYQLFFEKFCYKDQLAKSKILLAIYRSHLDAVASLQTHIRKLGGHPAERSLAWDAWTKLLQNAANKPAEQVALTILQAGEKRGEASYENILKHRELPSIVRYLIQWKLLLIQQSHSRVLERLLDNTAT
jgi:hypothetical protein